MLASAYRNSLKVAVENGVESIAFPNISTGIYHFPKPEAAQIAVKTVNDFLANNQALKRVIFACFDDENYRLYPNLLEIDG